MGSFCVDCTGQIEKAEVLLRCNATHFPFIISLLCLQFGALDGLYCRYGFHFGPDWSIVAVLAFSVLST